MTFAEIKKNLTGLVSGLAPGPGFGQKHGKAFYFKIATVFGVGFFILISHGMMNGKERKVQRARAELLRFEELKGEYLTEKARFMPFERKLRMPELQGSLGVVLENIGGSIGVGGNITSFKPIEAKAEKGYSFRAVELKMEGVSLNQLVNFLYRIENHGNLLLVRDFIMKSRLEDSDVFDITMQVALAVKER